MRNTVFIGHATPEDNDFAIWITSRLNSLGFKTWVDKKALIGGEKLWNEIDHAIRHEGVKYLLVYSRYICVDGQPGNIKEGISKEMSLAESIGKTEHINDYIILLNIDSSPFNLFIGADRFNHIMFADDWAIGLDQLVRKLDHDAVVRSDSSIDQHFSQWFQNVYRTTNAITTKRELYYSNLWPISNLPSKFYVYHYQTEDEAKNVYSKDNAFPISKASNLLTSFASPKTLQSILKDEHCQAGPLEVIEIDTDSILTGKYTGTFPLPREARNYLMFLLSRVFHLLMRSRGLFWYRLSNRRLAYYFTPSCLPAQKVTFSFPYRKVIQTKAKQLIGTYKNLGYWHYALSCKPELTPYPAFLLKNHIIFTLDRYTAWEDKNKMHTHRRAKGKRWFNAEWRDLFLGFLQALADKNNRIQIRLSEDAELLMSPLPLTFWSDFGYIEPKSTDRLAILYNDNNELEVITEEGPDE